jgi:hypothetical protein
MFLIDFDRGYPEIFQYLKFLVIIGSIIYLMYLKKEYRYFSWLVLFILLLFDDAFGFHEQFGEWMVERFNIMPKYGLRAQDLGELTYAVIFGALVFLSMIFGFIRGNQKFKKTSFDLFLLFSIFIFFGVGMDMLHSFAGDNRYIKLVMVLLEDGGEMISLSILTWYFIFLIIRPDTHHKYIYNFFLKN